MDFKNSGVFLLEDRDFECLEWIEAYELTLELCAKLREDGFEPSLIVGISRGGLVPARIASDFFGRDIRLTIVKVEFYSDIAKTQREPVISEGLRVGVEGERVLLVDDVADTGKSLALVNSLLKERGSKEVKILTLYKKPWTIIDPDYYARETEAWIIFPWEVLETLDLLYEKMKAEGKEKKEIEKFLLNTGVWKKLVEFFLLKTKQFG